MTSVEPATVMSRRGARLQDMTTLYDVVGRTFVWTCPSCGARKRGFFNQGDADRDFADHRCYEAERGQE